MAHRHELAAGLPKPPTPDHKWNPQEGVFEKVSPTPNETPDNELVL